jgi:beta-glucosidase
MPVTFPVSVDSLPAFEDYSMKGRSYKYMENNMMYPFGYGLTYGNVSYTDAQILNPKNKGKQPVEIQATLKNDGEYEIEEVAQLYLSAPGAGNTTPISSLIGFQRVKLQPNSSQVISFSVEPDLMKMVQEDGSKKLLKGTHTFIISGAAPCKRSEELGIKSTQTNFIIKN